MTVDKPFTLTELGNTYAEPDQRYVVSYILSYSEHDVASPEEAVARALALTRNDEAPSTHWYVFDRKIGELFSIEQGVAEDLIDDLD